MNSCTNCTTCGLLYKWKTKNNYNLFITHLVINKQYYCQECKKQQTQPKKRSFAI